MKTRIVTVCIRLVNDYEASLPECPGSPVFHGETSDHALGRLVASEYATSKLFENGKVALLFNINDESEKPCP